MNSIVRYQKRNKFVRANMIAIASIKEMQVGRYAELGKCSGEKNSQAKYKKDMPLSLELLLNGLPVPPKYFVKAQSIPERATHYLHWEKRKQLNKQLGRSMWRIEEYRVLVYNSTLAILWIDLLYKSITVRIYQLKPYYGARS
jgi:hypothetical protein